MRSARMAFQHFLQRIWQFNSPPILSLNGSATALHFNALCHIFRAFPQSETDGADAHLRRRRDDIPLIVQLDGFPADCGPGSATIT
jgi:hypothetical protein